MPKRYDVAYKNQIILSYKNGMPIFDITQKYHVSQSTIYRWLKEYEVDNNGHSAVEYNKLYQQNTKLEHVLQIIRLSEIIENVSLQTRLEILASLYDRFKKYRVQELCEALGVARGTFYNHIFRKADRTKQIQEQQELMLQVQQIFDDSKQRYGAEKIRVSLAENGVHVGKERIRKIMNELGLVSIRENAKCNYQKRQEYQKRNLLNQNFKATRKDEVWVSDITYFKLKTMLFIYVSSLTCFRDGW